MFDRFAAARLFNELDAASSANGREQRLRQYTRQRRLRVFGWVLVALGAAMGVVHWVAHLGALGGQPALGWDLAAGYPAAAILVIAGFILVGQ